METSTQTQPRFAFQKTCIASHREIARDTWQLTFVAPELAQRARPGQFFMIRIAGLNDPLIGRALAMYDRHRDSHGVPTNLSVVYTVKGKFTTALSKRSVGEEIEVWGPLGNSFSTEPVEHLILVAGGVGQTPMLTYAAAALGKDAFGDPPQPHGFARRVTLCYGARTKDYLAGLDDFVKTCTGVLVATEDGSMGISGRVTIALESVLRESVGTRCRIACCGPEPMMHAVADMASRYDVPCDVSLETPMACGIGICFTCVAKVYQDDGEWDYKRTCMEGPIFDAKTICWD
jgi:dihydroorotate dehydrogenase electron transfer subunit